MKRLYYILLIFLSLILVFSLGLSIYTSSSLNKLVSENSSLFSTKDTPVYHFVSIIHKTDESYWQDIESGLMKASKDSKIAMEVIYTGADDEYTETLNDLEMAIASNVEGIIVRGYDTSDFSALIDKAFSKGIPVITIDSDCSNSKRVSFVGTSDFDLGSQAGTEVIKTSNDQINVAIILDNDRSKRNDNGSTFISGFKNAIKNVSNINLVTIKNSELGILGAKNALSDILVNNLNVNTIVCTSSNDTIGVAQQLVEYNKVGNFSVVGYDNSPEVLKYIQKGVIFSTLIPDPLEIGKSSVENLKKIKQMGGTSTSTLTHINIVNSDNVNAYIKNIRDGSSDSR
jgi:ABC-type sugar transport system, periplasmic component